MPNVRLSHLFKYQSFFWCTCLIWRQSIEHVNAKNSCRIHWNRMENVVVNYRQWQPLRSYQCAAPLRLNHLKIFQNAFELLANQVSQKAQHMVQHTQHTQYSPRESELRLECLNGEFGVCFFRIAILCCTGDGSVQSFIALFQYVKRLLYFVCDVRIYTKQTKCPLNVRMCGWNFASRFEYSVYISIQKKGEHDCPFYRYLKKKNTVKFLNSFFLVLSPVFFVGLALNEYQRENIAVQCQFGCA